MKYLFRVLLIVLVFPLMAVADTQYSFPQGKVSLFPSEKSEDDFEQLALRFTLEPEWHIYWLNSGDSGVPPQWGWEIQGGEVVAEYWQVPDRIPYEGLVNLGYEGEVNFLFDLRPTMNSVKMLVSLELEFLVCKIECIPYFASLTADFSKDAERVPRMEADNWPYVSATPAGVQFQIESKTSDFINARLSFPKNYNLKSLEIFPYDGEVFRPQAPSMEVSDDYTFQIPLQDTSVQSFSGLRFLVAAENSEGEKTAWEIPLTESNEPRLWLVLLWALVGGAILNIMPCVFPVLSIKVLSFLGPNQDRARLRISGWFYTLGVLASFLFLGGLLAALRASGESLGWGFQMQSPVVASGIAILFFWLGLNFLGFFEVGQSISNLGAGKADSSLWGSFLTGVLATVVATPCTAPFMGAALGASLVMPVASMLAVFAGLGLGMVLPFLMLAYFPGLLSVLPKPGAWMQTLKEFFAFPMFATVLWLLWVLSLQVGSDYVVSLLALMLVIGLFVWWSLKFKNERCRQYFLLMVFLLSFVVMIFLPKEKVTATSVSQQTQELWQHYSAEAVQQSLGEGRAVFIDFTAAWCITCQVNKKLVLHTSEIANIFQDHKVDLFVADWTDRDPRITEALANYGRNSLPLYVFYESGSHDAVLLPEILTSQIIKNLFKGSE